MTSSPKLQDGQPSSGYYNIQNNHRNILPTEDNNKIMSLLSKLMVESIQIMLTFSPNSCIQHIPQLIPFLLKVSITCYRYLI